jgi:LacI family transcriptional regulator
MADQSVRARRNTSAANGDAERDVILVSTGTSEPNAKRLLDAKIPMVLVDRDLPQMDVDRVLADNYKGAQDLVHYLATLGHRRIGIIGANVRRLSSFKDGIAKASLDFDPKLEVVIEKPSFEMAVAATRKLLKRAHPPTTIMAENDLLAVGALNGTLRTGLHKYFHLVRWVKHVRPTRWAANAPRPQPRLDVGR